tara:strand:- start:173 stop:313 length:141 start_codon:yes stop_codon:yes gene_type:complete
MALRFDSVVVVTTAAKPALPSKLETKARLSSRVDTYSFEELEKKVF